MTRLALAAGFGLLVWALIVALTVFRVAFNPFLWERVTLASLGWTLAFAALFAAAGILCERLALLPVRILRYLLIGGVVVALLWSYLTATWAFTARVTAVVEPAAGVAEAALTGASLGAIGGFLLLVVVMLRGD